MIKTPIESFTLNNEDAKRRANTTGDKMRNWIMIRNWIVIGLIFGLPQLTMAGAIDSSKKAKKVQERLIPTVFEIKGVNGISIAGCDPFTGQLIDDFNFDYVHCVVIWVETDDTKVSLEKLFPPGTQIDNVYVVIDEVGLIEPEQPRMTGGN